MLRIGTRIGRISIKCGLEQQSRKDRVLLPKHIALPDMWYFTSSQSPSFLKLNAGIEENEKGKTGFVAALKRKGRVPGWIHAQHIPL